MSFLSRLKSAFRFNSVTRSLTHPFLRGDDSSSTPALLTSAFHQSAWVYACVTTLAENVSAIPFRILEKQGRTWEPAQHHELLRLFEQPHPHMDRFAFWELIVSWLCLRGEAFILPTESSIQNPKSKIQNLLVLNPDAHHVPGRARCGCGQGRARGRSAKENRSGSDAEQPRPRA
jgi:phage portal protein BeeE